MMFICCLKIMNQNTSDYLSDPQKFSDMFLKSNFGYKVLHEALNNLTKSLVVEKNSTKYLVCNKTKRFRSCDESVTNLFSQCLMLL